ncbi:Uncharacterised protein [Klebsiella pneumoniae]|uniref:hypothetical protein n=1 Tax=Klebsiella TaxID=570 RepID=UPI000E2E239B|nr:MULTISPECIES: hypothetical protein [Klebsiella]MBZ7339409.1 hypothetical protein [Klebsiella grimontii]SXG88303.1 Uncharacterised protein [Klebsiella pneumoniae]
MFKALKLSMTKEQLKSIIETDHVQCGEAAAMAGALLRILEQKLVAWRYRTNMKNVNDNWMFTDEKWRTKESITFESEPLYTLSLTVSD